MQFRLYIPGETASPTIEIDVTTPASFPPRSASGEGWQTRIDGPNIVFTGGSIPSAGLGTFDIQLARGLVPADGRISLPIVLKAADGSSLRWVDPPTGPYPALVLELDAPPSSSFLRRLLVPAALVAGLAAAVGVGLVLRRQLMLRSRPRQ